MWKDNLWKESDKIFLHKPLLITVEKYKAPCG